MEEKWWENRMPSITKGKSKQKKGNLGSVKIENIRKQSTMAVNLFATTADGCTVITRIDNDESFVR